MGGRSDKTKIRRAMSCLVRAALSAGHQSLTPEQKTELSRRMAFFLPEDRTAEVLGIAPITVKREWSKARAWLYNELRTEHGE